MMWGFGHGLWFLLPLFLLGRFFWIVILALLIGYAIRRFGFRHRYAHYAHAPFYHYNVPPTQQSALEILRQRYARGEIDAATFDQMRERLQAGEEPRQQ